MISSISNFFKFRFTHCINEIPFTAELDCDSTSEATKALSGLRHAAPNAYMETALIGFNLERPDGSSCFHFDETSAEIFVDVLKALQLEVEHFHNPKIGFYDVLNNVIAPIDMGMIFPDWTLRVVWNPSAKYDFDTSLRILQGVLCLLFSMQEMPYFRQTSEEADEMSLDGEYDRRTDVLFRNGLWPSTNDEFEFCNLFQSDGFYSEQIASILEPFQEAVPEPELA